MTNTSARPSVRATLRAQTAAAHERLHGHPYFAALLRGTITRAEYTQMLERLLGFHSPLEQELVSAARRLRLEAVMQGRLRVADLEQDLLDLGVGQARLAELPRARVERLETKDRFFGTLYVREGSTLGGSVLAKSLDRLLSDHRGRRFLSGYQHDRNLWQHFLAELELAGETRTPVGIVEGAEKTFAAMEDWLDGTCST